MQQYPMAVNTPGVVIIRVKSTLLCFSNANSIGERMVLDRLRTAKNLQLRGVVLPNATCILCGQHEETYLVSIDTSGIASMEELHKSLVSGGKQVASDLQAKGNKLCQKIGGRVFLTVGEAIDYRMDFCSVSIPVWK
ncbi:hypothetical protein RJT34_03275 [Clitoria ternatea]|uniref:Uncharacterized protein n=1 Tax=Clitoria ternatea TaxID=43366 RepID=A0AAN9Q1L6_CLITE